MELCDQDLTDSEERNSQTPQEFGNASHCIVFDTSKSNRTRTRDKFLKTKKNIQERLKFQKRTKHSDNGDKNCEHYIRMGDRLCDVRRFSEALCAYGQAFIQQKQSKDQIGYESLIYCMQTIFNILENSAIPIKQSKTKQEGNQWQYYTVNAGDPCLDPLSCPSCSGVLVDPVTLPCGHTFCRQHVINNKDNNSNCPKCKAQWRSLVGLHQINTNSGDLELLGPEGELNNIAANTLVNNLVHKYWTGDLQVLELKNKANKFYGSQELKEALQWYNKAFEKDPNDHLVLCNRSITHLKLGNHREALEDADLAVALRPDYAKGHFRRGTALKMLGNHEEAFKAVYSCLLLEDTRSKPVKQELAKELHILLKTAATNLVPRMPMTTNASDHHAELGDPTDSVASSLSDNPTDSSFDFKASDLPDCLKQLSAYLEKLSDPAEPGSIPGGAHASKWLIVNHLTYQRPYRQVAQNAIDSTDYECPLCMRLLWKPITTPCGHTFCKTCLDRVLDHNTTCPMCKSSGLKSYLSERRELALNDFVEHAMKRLLPNEYSDREKIHEAEMKQHVGPKFESNTFEVPIFVCTMSFPSVTCPLHVFEPRYRLMIRRCMEVGTREFGMCCNTTDPDKPSGSVEKPFADYGTMLEVRDIKYFPDGRSIVDTIGGRRFKVLSRHVVDGYNTARVKFLVDDTVGLEQLADLKKLHEETLQQTKDWFDVAFPNYKRISILEHYGKLPDVEPDYWALPNGPSWLWWILNILPVDYKMKIQCLSMTSLKKRLLNIRRILTVLAEARNKSRSK